MIVFLCQSHETATVLADDQKRGRSAVAVAPRDEDRSPCAVTDLRSGERPVATQQITDLDGVAIDHELRYGGFRPDGEQRKNRRPDRQPCKRQVALRCFSTKRLIN